MQPLQLLSYIFNRLVHGRIWPERYFAADKGVFLSPSLIVPCTLVNEWTDESATAKLSVMA